MITVLILNIILLLVFLSNLHKFSLPFLFETVPPVFGAATNYPPFSKCIHLQAFMIAFTQMNILTIEQLKAKHLPNYEISY